MKVILSSNWGKILSKFKFLEKIKLSNFIFELIFKFLILNLLVISKENWFLDLKFISSNPYSEILLPNNSWISFSSIFINLLSKLPENRNLFVSFVTFTPERKNFLSFNDNLKNLTQPDFQKF